VKERRTAEQQLDTDLNGWNGFERIKTAEVVLWDSNAPTTRHWCPKQQLDAEYAEAAERTLQQRTTTERDVVAAYINTCSRRLQRPLCVISAICVLAVVLFCGDLALPHKLASVPQTTAGR
jgi:hypothetical protein